MSLSTSQSDIKVFNAALAEIGVPKISSFTQNSIASRTGNAAYADILEEALSAYPWRFARAQIKLTRLDEDAPAPWVAVYALPREALVVHSVREGRQLTQFDVFGRSVAVMTPHASLDQVDAEITQLVKPDNWPGYFRRPFIVYLAASITMPITQDERLAGLMAQKAQAMFAMAKSRDAQGRTPSRIDTKAFIRQRRSSGRTL